MRRARKNGLPPTTAKREGTGSVKDIAMKRMTPTNVQRILPDQTIPNVLIIPFIEGNGAIARDQSAHAQFAPFLVNLHAASAHWRI
ncbi:MAG: hypothetical protein LBD68_08560 [Zoogloeaceae bacterium]|jgi:hypothetical protein|nr:hypothetical protein [Zoogloeaceae bacterium]